MHASIQRGVALALAAGSALLACVPPPVDEPPVVAVDSDGDGVLDAHEGTGDPDYDGIPNYLDLDSDGDDLLDALEAGDQDVWTLPVDADQDGVPDLLDDDSDGNGVLDLDEGPRDLDGDGIHNAADLDDDNDGLPDVLELHSGRPIDTDRDGRPDHRDVDSDDDGIPDDVERSCTHLPDPCDTDGDGEPDVVDLDADGDGFMDAYEAGVDPEHPRDLDGDGRPDWRDRDADGDGLDDARERDELGTNPQARDSDGDGFTDAAELEVGTDPNDAMSRWEGWYVEVNERTQREESLDFELGVERIDVVFLYDAYFWGRHRQTEPTDGIERVVMPLVERWSASIGDPAFGFVELGGYPEPLWSLVEDPDDWRRSDGCRPIFVDVPLVQGLSPFRSSIERVIDEWDPMGRPCHYRAPYEAFSQLLAGGGYDAWCDGAFDELYDLPPWKASPDDLFGGEVDGRQATDGTLGLRPGLGYRPFARPIFVFMVGAQYTDPGLEHPDPDHATNRAPDSGITPNRTQLATTPPMCDPGTTREDVAALMQQEQAFVLTVLTDITVKYNTDMDPTHSLNLFLDALDTPIDLDGDGKTERPLIISNHDLIIEKGEDPSVTDAVGAVIEGIENEIDFDSVTLEVEGDEHGFVTGITPARYTGLQKGDSISFALQFRGMVPALENDQVFRLGLNVLTDDRDLVDHRDILIVVPGRTR